MTGRRSEPLPKIQVEHLDFYYDTMQALFDISLTIYDREIGFHRTFRLWQVHLLALPEPYERRDRRHAIVGKVSMDGEDIYAPTVDVADLRKRVGLVFQKPNPSHSQSTPT